MIPYTKLAVAAVIGLALVAGGWKCYKLGQKDIQASWDREKLSILKQSEIIVRNVGNKENEVRQSAEKQRKDDAKKLATTRASYERTIAGLQNRPNRPGDERVSENRSTGDAGSGTGNSEPKGCTGQELYKQDAEFLARETARAELYQIRYESCYQRYAKVKMTLDELATSNK